ncbi:zinc finger protein 345-like [Anopheles merus]|uniref:Uncharacterized protein n=1 Tax=Anopheles merus TaxID=30066 RepID=A0A182VP35_ANOME|nr:zinc finger protein 345-like [Anopheles merus]
MRPKHCRICYKPDNDDLISVRLKQDDVSIEEMILSLTGISVTCDRRLPQNICLDCLDRLKVAYGLRQQCIRTNDWLCEELLESKTDVKVQCKAETTDAPHSKEPSEVDNGDEEMVPKAIAIEVSDLPGEENGQASSNERGQSDHSDDECNASHDNIDGQTESETAECLEMVEELEEEASSLQQLEIEIDTGENECDTKEVYLLSESSSSEEELRIEMIPSEESTVDVEMDLDDVTTEEQNDEEWEQQTTENSPQQAQTTNLQRAMCRISEPNLHTLSVEQGYSIVELRHHRCCCCTDFFPSEEELSEHLQRRGSSADAKSQPDPTARYVCEYCGKQFKLWLVYICHKRLREQRQFYQCQLCLVLLDSATRMISHMLMSEQHANYFKLPRESIADRYTSIALPGERCCCCKKYFDRSEKRLEHVQLAHRSSAHDAASNLPYVCDACGRKFRSKERLNDHLQYTVDVRQHYCKQCDFQTFNPRRMELHLYSGIHREMGLPAAIELKPLKNSLPKGGRLQYCCFQGCGKPFPHQEALQQHIQAEHLQTLADQKAEAGRISRVINPEHCHECINCGVIFKSASALHAHQTTATQRNRQAYVCSVCGVRKRTRTDLAVHERAAHTGERPFACEHCDKTFASKKTLASHRLCHTPGQYACELCGGKFNRKEHLTRHTLLKHGTATIPCEVCGKMFKTRATLTNHMVSHTGEKRFQCRMEGCDKRYGTVGDRRRHEMSVHTQERPHPCVYCDATFVRKRQLTIHERRHRGEKPFVCPDCGKDFIDGYPLRVHRRGGCKGKL